MRKMISSVFVLALMSLLTPAECVQSWAEQPRYQEVNPLGNVVLTCLVNDLKGACRWEKDGSPIGMEPNKYEWAVGDPKLVGGGDCSLKILGAELQYDDGVWQCQVESSSYRVKDALISEGAQLVVRESPSDISLRRVGDEGLDITAKAGEEIDLECIVTGGNPPAKLRWFARDTEIQSGHRQDDRRSQEDSRTWVSVSRLTLPVSKADNGATIRCLAEHPTLDTPISAKAMLTIHYPPSVSIETSQLDYLEEEKDPLTLRCVSDSNPPASVIWRKEGLEGILSPDAEINFSPVTRHTAGLYSCTAENGIGRSKAAWVEVDVKCKKEK